jgi:hypothetical protein
MRENLYRQINPNEPYNVHKWQMEHIIVGFEL